VQCAVLGALLGCAGTPTITHRRSGSSTTLDGLHGKVVVVNFWAEWCKPCIGEIPDIARVTDSMGPEVLFLPVYYRPDPGSARLAEWIDAQPAYFRDRVCFASSTFLESYDLTGSRTPTSTGGTGASSRTISRRSTASGWRSCGRRSPPR
jgi:thiol-disulfide isomerase/thioredoxin